MENISRKIELFGEGKISEDDVIIDYNENLKNDCFVLMSDYWTVDREYYYQFITSADLHEVISPSATTPSPSFNMNDYLVTSGDIEDETGIDFANDYGITGDYITGVVFDINTIIDSITGDLQTAVSGLTSEIPGTEIKVQSPGIMDLQRVLSTYHDNNDTNDYYDTNLDTVMGTESIVFTSTEKADVKEILLEEFLRLGGYKMGSRVSYNVKNDLMYSKLLDDTTQKICTEKIPEFSSKTSDEGRRIGISLNSLMPTDVYIYNSSDQWELLTTATNLIDEMDIAIKAMQNKGYPV